VFGVSALVALAVLGFAALAIDRTRPAIGVEQAAA
jgi:hypothetical protein